MALFKITTLVQFKHDYFVQADCLEHAYDEIVMRDSGYDGDYFDETAQTFIGEAIINGEESAFDEFDDFLAEAKNNDRSSCSHWMGRQLIRTVNYNDDEQEPELPGIKIRAYNNEFDFSSNYEETPVGHEVFKQMGTSLILGNPNIGKPGPKEATRYSRSVSNRGY